MGSVLVRGTFTRKASTSRCKSTMFSSMARWQAFSTINCGWSSLIPIKDVALPLLSTFPANADALLRLPEEFPEVDFVFRPHPLLFVRLADPKWWGAERVAAYCERMKAHPNVEFQQGGDYFATFAESDALIHDCASFLAEYFYTGRPQCFMLEGMKTVDRHFLPFSRRLLDHVYKAFSEPDIVAFVRDVVLKGEDPLAEGRARFAAEEVCVNHPNAAGRVVDAVVGGIETGRI